jgi:hypothetical protein
VLKTTALPGVSGCSREVGMGPEGDFQTEGISHFTVLSLAHNGIWRLGLKDKTETPNGP